MQPTVLFSFGYDGWGNATPQLVEAVDTIEKSRGFDPPLFIDIRLSRGGRAVGFRDTNFENLLGYDRYLWLDDLGNLDSKERTGRVRIKNRRAAEVLLTLALENSRRPRRVIFFCWCQWPVLPEGGCHRVTVASLVCDAAKRRALDVEVVEWPGGTPRKSPTRIEVSEDVARRVSRGVKSIPLGERTPTLELLGLPWGSMVELVSTAGRTTHFVGPAYHRGGQWMLPQIDDESGNVVTTAEGLAVAAEWRRDWGFEPRYSSVGQAA